MKIRSVYEFLAGLRLGNQTLTGVATTIATPGTDTNLATEKAIRAALVTNGDTITYTWKNTTTITLQPGVCLSEDGTQLYTVATATDLSTLDTGTLGASSRYYVWSGLASGVQAFRLSLSATTPTGLTAPKRLRWAVATNSSSQIIRFAPAKLNADRAIAIPYDGLYTPVNCLPRDGAAYLRTDVLYADLYAEIGNVYDLLFTAATTDICTSVAHGFLDTNQVTLQLVSGTLPGGLSEGVTYFIRDKTADTFKLALTSGGTAVDITGTGSGVFTIAPLLTFRVPDSRGRVPVGAGTGSGLTQRVLGVKGGEEAHVITITEMPAHRHNSSDSYGNPPYSYGQFTAARGDTNNCNPSGSTGGDTAHNTMPPYIVINFIVRY